MSGGQRFRRGRDVATFRRAGAVAVGAAAALAAGSFLALAPPAGAAPLPSNCSVSKGTATCTFDYTGAAQTWTVPKGVTSALVTLKGASGGESGGSGSAHSAGGAGAVVTAEIPVVGGDTYQVNVGGAGALGAGGFNGGGAPTASGDLPTVAGGGGGASDLRQGSYSLADRLLVAAGGGGAGGAGGGFGLSGPAAGPSGGAGGAAGAAGTGGESNSAQSQLPPAGGGGGGSAASATAAGTGGAGGAAASFLAGADPSFNGGAGVDGATGTGGAGGTATSAPVPVLNGGDGGGGGGGYYGGGGGGGGAGNIGVLPEAVPAPSAASAAASPSATTPLQGAGGGGGGAGGSDYAESSATHVTMTGSNTGNGVVTISYTVPSAALTLNKTEASSSPNPVTAAGQKITYDFTLANTGNVALSDVAVVDTQAIAGEKLTSGPTCQESVLAAGASETCTAVFTVTTADLTAGAVKDSAVARGTDPAGATVTSNVSTLSIPVTAPAPVIISTGPPSPLPDHTPLLPVGLGIAGLGLVVGGVGLGRRRRRA
ncbi:MAG TPA: glycine-rich protein [Acidimicrobiales bacterium]|nr:glycine-rich protein [Acidimicrobiales bacterium]